MELESKFIVSYDPETKKYGFAIRDETRRDEGRYVFAWADGNEVDGLISYLQALRKNEAK